MTSYSDLYSTIASFYSGEGEKVKQGATTPKGSGAVSVDQLARQAIVQKLNPADKNVKHGIAVTEAKEIL